MTLSAPVDWLPLVALLPLQVPEAAQFVASLLDQVRVEAAPLVTLAGLALIKTVAAWAAVTLNASAMPHSTPTRHHANKYLFDGTDAVKVLSSGSLVVMLHCIVSP